MTDMIERVARAMCEADSGGGEGMCDWVCYKPQAIAAIKAMREPTDFMVTQCAGYLASEKLLYGGAWRCMIDAALKGTEQ